MDNKVTVSVYSASKRGIGGWLIVPATGLALAPVGFAFIVFGTIVFITSQDLSALWNRDPAIVLVGLLEFLGYLVVGVLACKASYVFFKRKLTAPKLVERLGIVEFVFETIRSILHAIISGGGEVWIGIVFRIFAGAIALGVWVAYFEMSRRVQATFVD